MRVVSFYTDEKYQAEAEDMKTSAEAVGLECTITKKPDLGKWYLNCNQKSAFLMECLELYGDEPILYQDADTRLLRYPKLLDNLNCDFAAFFNSPTIPIGATLWFNGKTRAMKYVRTWVNIVKDHPTREDDSINFREALSSIRNPNIHHLPPTYCWHEQTMRSAYPGATDPIIIHGSIGAHDYPIVRQ